MLTKQVPTTVVDGFYDDPELVREFALRQEFFTSKEYVGQRTRPLHEIDQEFFDHFCYRLMALQFDLMFARAEWGISTAFHIVDPTDQTPSWVHQDDRNSVAAGVIYLSHTASFDEGTSIYTPNQNIPPALVNHWASVKESYHGEGVDEDYAKTLTDQHTCFDETARIGAKFNRLALYESSAYHAARPSTVEQRLTQVFFITNVTSGSRLPVGRMRQVMRV